MEDAVRDGVKVDEVFRHVKRQLEKLVDISKVQANPIEIIKKSTQLME
jgi:acetolactate synthase small subunit